MSTSQTSFQGLGEPIPSLISWYIRLSKRSGSQTDISSGALVSTYEMEHKRKGQVDTVNKSSEPRHVLFGLDRVAAPPAPSSYNPLLASAPEAPRRAREDLIQQTEDECFGGNADTIIPDIPELATQESTWAESGLTATYDIPGLRTISPSRTTRRQKITSITLKDIQLLYVVVPKLRAAASLKARFRNTSSIALLKGPAGLTLDGSFLGNTNIPRCSAGETFSLSLGVDPSASVTYDKPVVKRN